MMINQEQIKYLMTLRYNPHRKSNLPVLGWKDFLPYDYPSEITHKILEGSIKKELIDYEGTIGMGLSGGLDSTTVLALTRKLFPDININSYCITFGKDNNGDIENSKRASEIYNTNHKHIVIDNPFENFKEQIAIVKEPRWNLYSYYLFKEVSKDNIKLVLTGDGGDELYGGYIFRYKKMLYPSMNSNVVNYVNSHNRDWVKDQEEIFVSKYVWKDIYEYLNKYFDNPLSLLDKIFLADYNGKLLYDFEPTNSAFAKHFGVKSYSPMLEPENIRIASHIPFHKKFDKVNGVGKLVLRKILLDNYGYKLVSLDKIGWGIDSYDLWKRHVKNMFKDYSNLTDIINVKWIEKSIPKADSGDISYIHKMFGLLALKYYLELNNN